MRPGLTELEIDSTIFRPATYIEMSLRNLRTAILIGCLLVIAILVLFLWDWRTALISVLAIPLSLLAAALVLHLRGGTINTMVLAGLVIALGEVVDDAIIDVENIVRRLRANAASGAPASAFTVILRASLEVRSAVVYATLIVALVFIPVFLLDGLAGAFFRPLATSYLLAVLASLAVAVVVTPALAYLLLPDAARNAEASGRRGSPLLPLLRRRYRALLPRLVGRPALAVGVIGGLLGATALARAVSGRGLPASLQELDFLMHWVEKPGTSLEAGRRVTLAASRELRAVPGVRNFGSHIGRAEVADEVVGPNFTELWISLDPEVDYDRTVAKVQEIVDGYPGLYRDLLTYLRERIKEVLTGAGASLVVRLYGPNLDVLRAKADRRGQGDCRHPGVADLKVEPQVLVPQIEVALRPEPPPSSLGLTPGARAAGGHHPGPGAARWARSTRSRRSSTWWSGAPPATGSRPSRCATCASTRPRAARCRWGELADVRVGPRPTSSSAKTASRRIDVTANVRGRDLGSVAARDRARVRAMPFPRRLPPGDAGRIRRPPAIAAAACLLAGLLSLLGIFLILQMDFGSLRLALLVFASLPFALVGGVVGGAADRRGAVAGLAGRVHHRARHRRPQRHHAGQPLPPPGAGGGDALRPRAGPARRRGAAGPHPDDRAGHRPGPAADRDRQGCGPVTRSSTPWRWSSSGGLTDVDHPEPVPAAGDLPTFCPGDGGKGARRRVKTRSRH